MNELTGPQRLVRILAFALRHQPQRFGVALDDEGFADLDELVVGIRFSDYDWATLDRHQVEDAVRDTESERFEVRDGLVRARYGHSVVLRSPGKPCVPPDTLWHGTSAEGVAAVLVDGLRPMGRAFVHMTTDADYAAQVAASKGGRVMIRVAARAAAEADDVFYQSGRHVWLAKAVAPKFLVAVPSGGMC